jgi:hypothetical protein
MGCWFSSDDGKSQAQIDLREHACEYSGTRLTGALTGTLIGAAGGALIADQTGGDAAVGAAAGGVAGALIGYAAGAYVANRNAEAAQQQASLRSGIAGAEADAERYSKAADAARQVADQRKAEIARLNADYAQNRITAEQYSDKIEGIDGDLQSMKMLLVESEGNIQLMERDIQELHEYGRDTSNLAAAKRDLEEENARLREAWNELVASIEAMPTGVERPAIT